MASCSVVQGEMPERTMVFFEIKTDFAFYNLKRDQSDGSILNESPAGRRDILRISRPDILLFRVAPPWPPRVH